MKTLSDITQAITQAVVLNRHEDQKNVRALNRKKFFFGGFLTIMSLTLLVLTIFITVSARDKQNLESNKPKAVELIVPRNKWMSDLGRIGSKHLKIPVKKVILFEKTLKHSETCQKETCSDVEGTFYPNFEDWKENFVCSTDGKIFEARGFARESEVAFDEFGTSYNNDAISMDNLFAIFLTT